MNINKNQVLNYINELDDLSELVAILELSAFKSRVNTISETARINGITHAGVIGSKRYRKVRIGKQLMAVSGLRDNGLPF